MNVAVLICTYGDDSWAKLANEHAYPSADRESRISGASVHRVHDSGTEATLARVRNETAEETTADWLCFLDADDALGAGYLDAMHATLASRGREAALLIPSVQYVRDGVCEGDPAIPARGRLVYEVNAAVIGTLVPRDLFLEVGGFREEPLYEDWSVFLRLMRAGAVPVAVPDAVYCADAEPGRNQPRRAAREAAYWAIRREHEPHLQGERWP